MDVRWGGGLDEVDGRLFVGVVEAAGETWQERVENKGREVGDVVEWNFVGGAVGEDHKFREVVAVDLE